MQNRRITAIQRWPVKGLGPDPLDEVMLSAGRPLPYDRAWAIENGPSGFISDRSRPIPKTRFLMLMKNERLAALETRFDDQALELTVFRHGKRVAGGRLDDPVGRKIIEQFFAAYMDEELRGAPKLLSAENGTFADIGEPAISIIGLGSLNALQHAAGRSIDPLRFRANLHIDGIEPWAEFDLVGRRLLIGEGAVLRITGPITRCAAVNVDPATGARDMQIPRLIESAFGHCEFGVYAQVVQDGRIGLWDSWRVLDDDPAERPLLPF